MVGGQINRCILVSGSRLSHMSALVNTNSKVSLCIHRPAISHRLVPQELHEQTDKKMTVVYWTRDYFHLPFLRNTNKKSPKKNPKMNPLCETFTSCSSILTKKIQRKDASFFPLRILENHSVRCEEHRRISGQEVLTLRRPHLKNKETLIKIT